MGEIGEQLKDAFQSMFNGTFDGAKLRAELSKEDQASEIIISSCLVAIIISYSFVFLAAPKAQDNITGFQPVLVVLALALPIALTRLAMSLKYKLQGWLVYGCILFDIVFLSSLIWSFHIQYDQPPGLLLKAPTFVHFFIFIALRSFQYNIGYLLFSGGCAICAWLTLTFLSIADDSGEITSSFVTYLTSSQILIGAEVEKILALTTFVLILVCATIRSTQRFAERLSALENAHRVIESERSKRLEAERLRLKFEEQKVKFLTIASHELRTPMNGIIGTLDVMDRSTPGIQEVSDSADNLLQIINKMVTLTSADQISCRPAAHSVKTIVARIKRIGEMVSDGVVYLPVSCDLDDEDVLYLDWNIIEPILKELLLNAIKFGRDKSIEVSMTRQGSCVVFDIWNAGSVITQGEQGDIFELFTQTDDELTRSSGGMGLGLPMAARLAEACNSKLSLLQSDNTGTVFRLSIAEIMVEAPGKTPKATLPQDDQPTVQHQPPRQILVVEDNLINQKVMLRMLERVGGSVVVASNGYEGLEAFKKNDFDTVLMDIQMPVMDGCEATQLIRQYELKHNRSPSRIIAVTAHAYGDYFSEIRQYGFDELMIKPVRLETVRSVLFSE